MTNYDVTRVERKTAELLGIISSVQKRAQNREKTTSGDYFYSINLTIQENILAEYHTGIHPPKKTGECFMLMYCFIHSLMYILSYQKNAAKFSYTFIMWAFLVRRHLSGHL